MLNPEELAAANPQAKNNPYEPFQGVKSLFNGDLHAGNPAYAPREDWIVISPFHIEHVPIEEDMTDEKLTAYYQAVDGTQGGVPSNEPVPIFPHTESQSESDHA